MLIWCINLWQGGIYNRGKIASSVNGVGESSRKLQAKESNWTTFSHHIQRQTQNGLVKVKSLNHVQLFVTPWTVAYQAPPSMGFSLWEYWSGSYKPKIWNHKTPRRKHRQYTLLSVLAMLFWICLLRQGKQKKKKINKRDYINLKGFFTVKESINKTKGSTEWEYVNDLHVIYPTRSQSKICKELTQLNIENKNNPIKKKGQKKKGRGPEGTFFQRRHADVQQAYEEILNITNHQGNIIQKHNEISPHA